MLLISAAARGGGSVLSLFQNFGEHSESRNLCTSVMESVRKFKLADLRVGKSEILLIAERPNLFLWFANAK